MLSFFESCNGKADKQGRKRAGGIRFGEMERDALIAHGTSFLLQDRLMNCSDYSTAWVCRNCGSLITLGFDQSLGNDETGKEYCRVCDKEEDGVKVEDGKVNIAVQGKKDRKGVMDVIAVPCKSSRPRVNGC
jgi:DNA-directed RNA polymerase I subunit RPA2